MLLKEPRNQKLEASIQKSEVNVLCSLYIGSWSLVIPSPISPLLSLISIILFSFLHTSTYSQATNIQFGQNRVQYKDFIFSYYDTDHFTVYFYQGGQDVGKYVIKQAEGINEDLQRVLDFKYRRKIDIIVYNSINELNQTNIGIYEAGNNEGGTTNLPDNKIFLYFNGSHEDLDIQLRERLGKLYLDKLLTGSSVLEFVQNAVALNMPDWFRNGFIQNYARGWNSNADDRLRDGIMSGRYAKLNKLDPSEAMFVGHSIWHYVEEKYGKQAAGNLMYLARINRSVDNGFLFVVGQGLDETLTDWFNYYLEKFKAESELTQKRSSTNIIKRKSKNGFEYYQPRMSSDGKTLAFAQNDLGRYKVKLLDTEKNKKKTVVKGGWRTNTIFTDDKQPLLAWTPSGKQLAVVFEKKAVIYLGIYDLGTKKIQVKRMDKFQKVLHINFMGDDKNLAISAVQNGQSDIFLYRIASTTVTRLTNDYFDDFQPCYIEVDGMRGIMFSSNRPTDEKKEERFLNQSFTNKQLDLFFINLNETGKLHQITNTRYANETYAQQFSENTFSFLSDANGINNRHTGTIENVFDHWERTFYYKDKESGEEDSITINDTDDVLDFLDETVVSITNFERKPIRKLKGETQQHSNYFYNVREQQLQPAKGFGIELVKQNNRTLFYKMPIDFSDAEAPTAFVTNWGKSKRFNTKASTLKSDSISAVQTSKSSTSKAQNPVRDPRPYDFQSEFDYDVIQFDWDSLNSSRNSASFLAQVETGFQFMQTKVRPYFVKFSLDDIVTQLDNNLILTRYQPFNPNNPNFFTPPVSFAIKLGITDLLENHKIYGGLRLPFSGISGNSEYFITYENLKKRLDKKFTYYRQSITQNNVAIKTNFVEADFRYPLDVLQRLGFGVAYRHDKTVFKAVDSASLFAPNISSSWLYLKGEYVFDNTLVVQENIRYGFRVKAFVEIHKEFPFATKTAGEQYDFSVPQMNNAWFTTFGIDARHYLKIFRQIIWANRLSWASSVGNRKLIYYLGAVDNWFINLKGERFDTGTPINTNNNYAFQTLATPLRGFLQNARNGNSYVVLNSELRIPLFAATRRARVRSEILRNFTIVGFVDAGTAWEGVSPFSDNNPLFTETYANSVSTVRIKRFKTPIIMGFGGGLRTSLLGYFMKLDLAWGYDTGEVTKRPIAYFTFGYDF